MLSHLTPIAQLISTKKEGYESLIKVLLPMVQRLLMDQVSEISIKATEVLANIAELLTEEDRGAYVLTIVLRIVCCNIKNLHTMKI